MLLFWLLTFLLLNCALLFFMPWLKAWRRNVLWGLIVFVGSYGIYQQVGSAQQLKQYFASQTPDVIKRRLGLRLQLADFRKKEFQLRIRLEQEPKNEEIEWKLLDLLALQAMYAGEFNQALEHWRLAEARITNEKFSTDKKRILRSIELLEFLQQKIAG